MKERQVIEAIVAHLSNLEACVSYLERLIVQGDRRGLTYELISACNHSRIILDLQFKDMIAESPSTPEGEKLRAVQGFIKEHGSQ